LVSEVNYRNVISVLGYDQKEDKLDKYYKDKVKSITEAIKSAEDLIDSRTGRAFQAGSSLWPLYNITVKQQAALFVLQAIRNYENNNTSMTVEGSVRFDKSQLGRQLSSTALRLQNEVDGYVDLLTKKVIPTLTVVTTPAH
jgi:hypothetical protein